MSKQKGSTMDRMGQIFTGMVMNDAIKDKEKDYQDGIDKMQAQMMDSTTEEMKIDEYGAAEKVRKDSMDSDEDFNVDDDSESILDAIKAKRLREMKRETKEMIKNKAKGHGEYREISQDDFLPCVTDTKRVVVHFYHRDFERCKIIDVHLREIAKQHLETKFVYLNAEKTPFFVTKLAIKVLPTLVLFTDGLALDRVVGFEDLGGEDEFETIILTRRLVGAKIIDAKNKSEEGRIQIMKKGAAKNDDSSDGDDY
jgi:thiol-disulfide isomerase/thioredoxin